MLKRFMWGGAAGGLALAIVSAPALAGTEPASGEGSPASPRSGDWKFTALLDGKPIGQHEFTLRDGEPRELRSVAHFDVKVLGFNAYRYRHQATEHWQGECLQDMSSTTDDDGKALSVQAQKSGAALVVKGAGSEQSLPGCVMSFAYWNPLILQQKQLLDPTTGRFQKVAIEALADGPVEVRGQPVQARHFRITGPEQPIELWYSMQGDWIGLDSKVSGGKRVLSYRLE